VPAPAAANPRLLAARGCYLPGQVVQLTGSGFAPNRRFDLADDGVDFGQSSTDGRGGFSVGFRPGGLPAGVAQHLEHLDATDGTASARATFTLTRATGARFLATRGRVQTLRAPFEVWGFGLDGRVRPVYVHYVSPSGRASRTILLGRAGGQCGYLRTRVRSLFPFNPSTGSWTLQLDARSGYTRAPGKPVTRIRVRVA
jgi:hypothetical protein